MSSKRQREDELESPERKKKKTIIVQFLGNNDEVNTNLITLGNVHHYPARGDIICNWNLINLKPNDTNYCNGDGWKQGNNDCPLDSFLFATFVPKDLRFFFNKIIQGMQESNNEILKVVAESLVLYLSLYNYREGGTDLEEYRKCKQSIKNFNINCIVLYAKQYDARLLNYLVGYILNNNHRNDSSKAIFNGNFGKGHISIYEMLFKSICEKFFGNVISQKIVDITSETQILFLANSNPKAYEISTTSFLTLFNSVVHENFYLTSIIFALQYHYCAMCKTKCYSDSFELLYFDDESMTMDNVITKIIVSDKTIRDYHTEDIDAITLIYTKSLSPEQLRVPSPRSCSIL